MVYDARADPHADCFGLLRALADGKAHSANRLAGGLGCSAARVRQRLRELASLGVPVSSSRGLGYRLVEPVDLIDRHALAALLAGSQRPFRAEVVDRCDSTNTELLARALNGASHASVLACEHQTAGRGRRGARWVSWIGGSLAFSLLWRFRCGVGGLSGLSLAVAVALARGLERSGAPGVTLKWPNDLLFRGRKLGGILIEMNGDAAGPSAAVIGVGLNVRTPDGPADVPGLRLAALSEAGVHASRTVLLARLLGAMGEALEVFEREGFGAFKQQWIARHAWQGRHVALKTGDRSIAEGEAVGVDDDGALLLRCSNAIERFHAGELSLRPA